MTAGPDDRQRACERRPIPIRIDRETAAYRKAADNYLLRTCSRAMRSITLPVSCPYCTTRAVVDCDSDQFRADRATRLKGTDIDCPDCGHEFELYYY